MKGDDSKELLNEWASFVPSTKEDWLSNCILFNKKFSSPLKICFQQYLLVWGNFKATPMLVLVHYSRSHPITTSSHSMATLLLVYFTLTQTFPLSPLQTPHSHPLWWIFLSLPWLKTGFSLKTSFLWSCSWLTPPVLEIRKLCPDSSFIYCRWKTPVPMKLILRDYVALTPLFSQFMDPLLLELSLPLYWEHHAISLACHHHPR